MSFFQFKGKNVFYDVQGDGQPVLLLNGIMMSTLSWAAFVPVFKTNLQLIRFDFLDQGQSDKMANEPAYTQALQVELIAALMAHLQLNTADIVGISYGGEVALQFAIAHPQKVRRLVLFNTCAYTTPWLSDIGKAWNLAASTGNGQAYYYTSIPMIYSPHFYEHRLEWMRKREQVLFPVFGNPTFTEAMVRLTNSAETHDVREKLSSIQCHTLVVSSDQDYITPMTEQQKIVKALPHSHYVLIPETGHASMYERPALFTSLVLGFLLAPTHDYTI